MHTYGAESVNYQYQELSSVVYGGNAIDEECLPFLGENVTVDSFLN